MNATREKIVAEALALLEEERKRLMRIEKMREVTVYYELRELGETEHRIKTHFEVEI